MQPSKRYFHDKLILLLLSIASFCLLLSIGLILFRLEGAGSDATNIVEYRSNLGLLRFRSGKTLDLLAFIAFGVFVFVTHTLVSIRIYPHWRHISVTILSLCVFILVMMIVVSNALLSL